MSARERLESYLDALRARLRTHIYARAAAIALAGVLAITAFTVLQFRPVLTVASLESKYAFVSLLFPTPFGRQR